MWSFGLECASRWRAPKVFPNGVTGQPQRLLPRLDDWPCVPLIGGALRR
jgi:hypothetical protein